MKSIFSNLSCIVCASAYVPEEDGVLNCPSCNLLFSGQKAGYGNPIEGMGAVAFRNYEIVADVLEQVISLPGAKILDVGSAEGGFIDLMLRRGANLLGLEPDKNSAKEAILKKLPFELVSFESFIGKENEYDAIVFNDVFEHMQDPCLSLEKAHKMLKDGAFVLINAPVSTGFIFRVVKFAALIGLKSPYQRIWAKGLSSPHIYFYSESNLISLLAKYQFEYVCGGRLVTLAKEGMYQRVRSTYGPLSSLVISSIASLFLLISSLFPADVRYLLFRKT